MMNNFVGIIVLFFLVGNSMVVGTKAPKNDRAFSEDQESSQKYPPPPFLLNWLKENMEKNKLIKKELTCFLEYYSPDIGNIQLAFCTEDFNQKFSNHLSERIGKDIIVCYGFNALNVNIEYVAENYPLTVSVKKENIRPLYPVSIILNKMNDPEIPKLLGNFSPNGWLSKMRLWILLFPKMIVNQIEEATFKIESLDNKPPLPSQKEILLKKKDIDWVEGKTIFDFFKANYKSNTKKVE